MADTLSRIRCAAFGAHVAALRGSHGLQLFAIRKNGSQMDRASDAREMPKR